MPCTTIRRTLTAGAAALMLGLGACSSTQSTGPAANTRAGAGASEEGVIYYPAKPQAPRLQFLMSFGDASKIATKKKDSFADWIVGSAPEERSNTRLDSPYGIGAYKGKLYVCDVGLNCIHVIDMNTGRYERLASPIKLGNPVNLDIDTDGTKYICDSGARVVLVYDKNDKFLRAIGKGRAWTPLDVAIKGNELYTVDPVQGKVVVFDKHGNELRSFGNRGQGPEELQNVTNVAIGTEGNIYVTDTFQQQVKVFTPEGSFVSVIGGRGADIGKFARPKGIDIDEHGQVYIADSQWDVVQIFTQSGRLLGVFGEPGDDKWSMGLPAGICIDKTSLDVFAPYVHPKFEAEYLLFVVNQFGVNKVAVYAYGKHRDFDAAAYEVTVPVKEE